METRHRILLLDDDPDLLEMYRHILARLSSQPEIRTASSGARAMAMLEVEPYRLLICDLKMPKMDGLQVLSIVRRKYPDLRTVVLTSVGDEQFRSRVYALGVDLFWQKPAPTRKPKCSSNASSRCWGARVKADSAAFKARASWTSSSSSASRKARPCSALPTDR